MTTKLDLDFYQQDTLTLSQALLGTYLIHDSAEGTTVGRIVETEAYLTDDPACHAYRRKTSRNAVMFGSAGRVYVYQIYGMHYCVNVVSSPMGTGEAVLIRALEPVEGMELMHKRRKVTKLGDLCKGPGRLVQAMGITQAMNGIKLIDSPLYILPATAYPLSNTFSITTTTRIGITKGADLSYRFYITGNRFVSFPEKQIKV